MNPPAKFTDDDVEALLRATFSAEARGRVPESRPVPPFPATDRLATVHPLRRRWTGIALVAAALVAVLVGALVVGDQVMDSKRAPVPAGTSVAPEPTVTPTVASPSTTPTTVTTPPSSPPAPTTEQITVQGVTLTVPTTWQVQTGSSGAENPGSCLTTTGQPAHETSYGADNCELTVRVGGGSYGARDVDGADFTPDGGICGTDGRVPDETVTTAADEITVDGVTVEYRVFTGNCIHFHIEQWSVPTAPFVQFTRQTGTDDPVALARALAVVQSAKLPGPRSPLRLDDHGYVDGMTGSTLHLDRITVMQGRGIVDNNPATYDYPVSSTAVVRYNADLADNSRALTVDDLRSLANGGTVPGVPAIGDLTASLTTDGQQVTHVELDDRG